MEKADRLAMEQMADEIEILKRQVRTLEAQREMHWVRIERQGEALNEHLFRLDDHHRRLVMVGEEQRKLRGMTITLEKALWNVHEKVIDLGRLHLWVREKLEQHNYRLGIWARETERLRHLTIVQMENEEANLEVLEIMAQAIDSNAEGISLLRRLAEARGLTGRLEESLQREMTKLNLLLSRDG